MSAASRNYTDQTDRERERGALARSLKAEWTGVDNNEIGNKTDGLGALQWSGEDRRGMSRTAILM